MDLGQQVLTYTRALLAGDDVGADLRDPHAAITPAATAAACAAAERPLFARERADIKRFPDGLELAPPYEGAEPDLAPAGMWAAVDPGAADTDGARLLLAAIARKP